MITKEALLKKRKHWGVGVAAGVLFVLAALAVLAWGAYERVEAGEPEDLYYAEYSGQYVYVPAQYMLEPFGTYESYGKMSLYFVFNEYYDPYIVCMDDREAAKYEDIMESTYSDSQQERPMRDIVGYAVPFDREIRELAIECYRELFGDYVDGSNFEEFFGNYYLQTGGSSGTYENRNVFLILLTAGVILLVLSLLQRKRLGDALAALEVPSMGTYGQGTDAVTYAAADMFSEQNVKVPGEVKGHNRMLGVLGALGGALLGSLLIVALGMAGYISGWAAVAVALLAVNGYKLLAKGIDKAGIAIAIAFTALVVVPANLVQVAIVYYRELNDMGIGYVSFMDALAYTPQFMTDYDIWGDFWYNVVLGYVLGGLCLAFYMPAIARSRQKYDLGAGNAPEGVYGAPDAYGARRMEVTLVMPRTGTRMLTVLAAAFLAMGLFMGAAFCADGQWGMGLMMFILMLVFSGLMFWAGQRNKGITYTADEQGIHMYRPLGKKHTDIAYREITELNVARGQCSVKTAERRKRIVVPLASFTNGSDFAYVVQTCLQRSREEVRGDSEGNF